MKLLAPTPASFLTSTFEPAADLEWIYVRQLYYSFWHKFEGANTDPTALLTALVADYQLLASTMEFALQIEQPAKNRPDVFEMLRLFAAFPDSRFPHAKLLREHEL